MSKCSIQQSHHAVSNLYKHYIRNSQLRGQWWTWVALYLKGDLKCNSVFQLKKILFLRIQLFYLKRNSLLNYDNKITFKDFPTYFDYISLVKNTELISIHKKQKIDKKKQINMKSYWDVNYKTVNTWW